MGRGWSGRGLSGRENPRGRRARGPGGGRAGAPAAGDPPPLGALEGGALGDRAPALAADPGARGGGGAPRGRGLPSWGNAEAGKESPRAEGRWREGCSGSQAPLEEGRAVRGGFMGHARPEVLGRDGPAGITEAPRVFPLILRRRFQHEGRGAGRTQVSAPERALAFREQRGGRIGAQPSGLRQPTGLARHREPPGRASAFRGRLSPHRQRSRRAGPLLDPQDPRTGRLPPWGGPHQRGALHGDCRDPRHCLPKPISQRLLL